jgi:ParB family transcriptional regulator, chromosome partitioning protein
LSDGAEARRGLGRGLEVLLGGAKGARLAQLTVGAIEPNSRQPRQSRLDEDAPGLAESVRAQGLLQPVVVRPRDGGRYELIAGERRWRAAKAAGLPTVPALVREADDRETMLLGLVENVARKDLSPVEEARAYAMLTDEFGLSLAEVAERVGHSKPLVSNRMRLLELPDDILDLVDEGQLSEGHARAVLGVRDQGGRRRLARRVVREGLSVRATERAARAAGARARPRRKRPVDPALAARVESAGERVLGVPVKVRSDQVEIGFEDEVGLADIAEALEWADKALTSATMSAPGD